MRLSFVVRCGVLLLISAMFGWFPLLARAEEPVLTVAGLADGAERQFTLTELRSIGSVEINTGTPWSDAPATFTGLTGRQLLASLGAALGTGGSEVLADAINDYRVTIPFEVLDSDDLLIAYARDGQPMPVRDKGPLWIVFPFDSGEPFVSETYKTYSIWNLKHLEFH